MAYRNSAHDAHAIGRLTKDIHEQINGDGSKRLRFRLAIDSDYRNRATGDYEADFWDFTTFISASAITDRAPMGPYTGVRQGDMIMVDYTPMHDTYTDKKTGEIKNVTVFEVYHMRRLARSDANRMLDKVERAQAAGSAEKAAPAESETVDAPAI